MAELARQVGNFLLDKPCRLYTAAFDVRLPEGDEDDADTRSVVQPDLVVVCDPSALDERGCRGAPDWIVEVTSPATAARDHIQKLALYERAGVTEYWIVHPTDRVVTVRWLGADCRYGVPAICDGPGVLAVGVLPSVTLDLDILLRD